jgi:hypothetical protein
MKILGVGGGLHASHDERYARRLLGTESGVQYYVPRYFVLPLGLN